MLRHNYIGTEHLLLGLIHEGNGVAAKALESLGVFGADIRDLIREIIGEGVQSPEGHIPFTPRAKQVIHLAVKEAESLVHNYVGTEHILLGLVREGRGAGCQLLARRGLELALVRKRVIDLLTGSFVYPASVEQADAKVPLPSTLEDVDSELSEVHAAKDEAIDGQDWGRRPSFAYGNASCSNAGLS